MRYFQIHDQQGFLKSGSPRLCDIEARRASLIAETNLKLDIEREGLAFDLSYLKCPRNRAAIIRFSRKRIAGRKSELKHWQTVPVEVRSLCR